MPGLKVCGITDAGFAVYAAEQGVDYLGFIFAANSPRCVTAERANLIAGKVRGRVGRVPRLVGVFTTQSVREILRIASSVRLDVIQLHGDYSDGDVMALKTEGYEVWRLWNGKPDCEDAVLLDGRRGNASGLAEWTLFAPLKAEGRRVVLAGSISSSNIADAIRTGADAIDVSSSLESAPGIKSTSLLDAFITAFRQGSRVA